MREKGGACRHLIDVVVGLLLLVAARGWAQEVGQTLPAWSPGTLDIHHISTGRGNAALLIFPDATSLLVDAGDLPAADRRAIAPTKPDPSRGAGEWVARYASHMLAHDTTPGLDYVLLTHFHSDHMGAPSSEAKMAEGGYALSGITEVAEHIPVRRILERGWPDYAYPASIEGPLIENYRAFLDWQIEKSGLTVERFEPGRADQIVLRRSPSEYPNFEVRNIAANGEVWTGVGTATEHHVPPLESLAVEDYPTENVCSVAIRVSYGAFDYYTGGDMPGVSGMMTGRPSWHDVEIPVARAVGEVEVAVLNHHGMLDGTSVEFLRATRPRVMVIPVWAHVHPDWGVLNRAFSTRLFPGERDVFATNLSEAARTVLGSVGAAGRLESTQGHTVVRVAPGGETFRVIVLEDSDESFRVRAIFGPYPSR